MKKLAILSVSLLLTTQHTNTMQRTRTKTETNDRVAEAVADLVVAAAKLPFQAVALLGEGAVEAVGGIWSWATSSAATPPDDNDPKKDGNHDDIIREVRDLARDASDLNVARVQACQLAMRNVWQRFPNMNKRSAAVRRLFYRRHVRKIFNAEKRKRRYTRKNI